MLNIQMAEKTEILLYQTEDGQSRVEVRLENETVWLTQAQMVELFQTTKQNISLHIRNIFQEGELQEVSVVKEYLTTASDGKIYNTYHYNLDVIISVGYRVKSHRGTQFRIWATQQLKEFLIKGFILNDERLKETGPTNKYFEELFERIRDIRSSEKIFYAKIKDIYALKQFLQTARDTKTSFDIAKQALAENMRHTLNWVQTTFQISGLDYKDRCSNGLGSSYPRMIIKVPTGGGKTLLAVEAIREYQNLFAQKRTGLVVWIVPSETIYSQPVQKIRDKGNPLRQLLNQCSGNRTITLKHIRHRFNLKNML
jgi:hypothetical protein